MQDLLPLAEKLGARLKARGDTIAIAESSTGGLISAALLSVGGASAYFRGGSVIYTQYARSGFLEIPNPSAGRHAGFVRALRGAVGDDGAKPARFDLGAERDRRHRSDRQSLWRCSRAYLHWAGGAEFLARHHVGDRQWGSCGQYAGVFQASDGIAGGGAWIERGDSDGFRLRSAHPTKLRGDTFSRSYDGLSITVSILTVPRCAPCRRAAPPASARSPRPSAPDLPRWDAAARRVASSFGSKNRFACPTRPSA